MINLCMKGHPLSSITDKEVVQPYVHSSNASCYSLNQCVDQKADNRIKSDVWPAKQKINQSKKKIIDLFKFCKNKFRLKIVKNILNLIVRSITALRERILMNKISFQKKHFFIGQVFFKFCNIITQFTIQEGLFKLRLL